MADEPSEPQHGLVVRLISWVLIGLVGFGLLLPLVNLALGESKGFGTDLREGLIQGAGWGVLMAILGDPLTRWLARLFKRRKGEGAGPGSQQ